MGDLTHKVSRRIFLGMLTGKAERNAASVYLHIKPDYPPTFCWHNRDDMSVPVENSEMREKALNENKGGNEFLYFDNGGHGIGLAEGKDAEGWIDKAADFLDKNL